MSYSVNLKWSKTIVNHKAKSENKREISEVDNQEVVEERVVRFVNISPEKVRETRTVRFVDQLPDHHEGDPKESGAQSGAQASTSASGPSESAFPAQREQRQILLITPPQSPDLPDTPPESPVPTDSLSPASPNSPEVIDISVDEVDNPAPDANVDRDELCTPDIWIEIIDSEDEDAEGDSDLKIVSIETVIPA